MKGFFIPEKALHYPNKKETCKSLLSFRFFYSILQFFHSEKTRYRTWRGFSLIAVDKCTLSLPENSLLYQKFKAHRTGVSDSPGPVAVEICCFFDAMLRVLLYLVHNKSNTSEHKMFPRLMKYVKKTHLILIDNGFYSWKHFDMIRKREAHFICPLTTSSRPKVIKKLNRDDYLCQ
ncbi:MAG: transposase, partial [Akkermansia sp.]